MTLEYTTPYKTQLNRFIERIFSVIKEGELSMMLNAKLNDTAQIILWAETFHRCKRVRNSLATTGSTTIPFGNFYGEKPKIVGSFLEFGRIGYVTKWENCKKQMTEKIFKSITVECSNSHTRYT